MVIVVFVCGFLIEVPMVDGEKETCLTALAPTGMLKMADAVKIQVTLTLGLL